MRKTLFIIATAMITLFSFAQPGRPEGPAPMRPTPKPEKIQPAPTTHAAGTIEASSFFENTYIRIQGGTMMPWTSGISGVTGLAGLEVGKNITPVFGLGIEGWMNFSNIYGGTAIDFSNVVVNARFNLSNAIGGYKGMPRLVEISVVPGIGWGHYYTRNANVARFDRNFLTYNTFAQVDFNLGKYKQFQINVQPGMMWLAGNRSVNFDVNRSAFICKVGFTYKFGRKTSTGRSHNFRICEHSVTSAEYERLYAAYEELYNRPEPKPRVEEKFVVKEVPGAPVPTKLLVSFQIGTSSLTEVEKIRIDEFISKLPKETVVVVVGSADLGTGSRRRNEILSRDRANVVIEYLKLKDVKVAEPGTRFDPYRDPRASRGAVIEISNGSRRPEGPRPEDHNRGSHDRPEDHR